MANKKQNQEGREKAVDTLKRQLEASLSASQESPSETPGTIPTTSESVPETEPETEEEEEEKTEPIRFTGEAQPVKDSDGNDITGLLTRTFDADLTERLGRGKKEGQEPRQKTVSLNSIEVTTADAAVKALRAFYGEDDKNLLKDFNAFLQKQILRRANQNTFAVDKGIDAMVDMLRRAGISLEKAQSMLASGFGR